MKKPNMKPNTALFLLAALPGTMLASCATSVQEDRTPAASGDPLDCSRYVDTEERRICAIIARQSLEAIGFHVQNRFLITQGVAALRDKINYPKLDLRPATLGALVGVFSAGGAGSAIGSALLSRRPGTFANRLLESVAVMPTGLKGVGMVVSSVGGTAAIVTSSSLSDAKIGDEGSSAGATNNLLLIFRKKSVDDAILKANEQRRVENEAALLAEVSSVATLLVNDKLQPLLYMNDDQATKAVALIKGKLISNFKTKSGRIDPSLPVTLDLIAILKSVDKDVERRLMVLDEVLRTLPKDALPDPSKISETARDLAFGYLFLVTDFRDIARATVEWKENTLAPAVKNRDKDDPTILQIQRLDADATRFVNDLGSFIRRLEMTRKFLTE